MVQEYKLPEGYYTYGPYLLIRLVHVVYQQKLAYVTQVVAISKKVPKDVRDSFFRNDQLYQQDKVHISKVLIANDELEEKDILERFKPIRPDEVDTLKLLYTSDQSAEGTTVEANTAVSTVSDAKSGGGQNAITKP